MIKINALGTARIDVQTKKGHAYITPAVGKRFGLVLYLAAQPACRVARTTLQELLLPATTDRRHGLRELLYQVRRRGVPIEGDDHTVALSRDSVRRDWIAITEG